MYIAHDVVLLVHVYALNIYTGSNVSPSHIRRLVLLVKIYLEERGEFLLYAFRVKFHNAKFEALVGQCARREK